MNRTNNSNQVNEPYVQILQWTPFPDCYEPIPEWQLQMAQYDLGLNNTYYYELAINKDGIFFYPKSIAQKITAYWRKRWKFAKYKLRREQKEKALGDCFAQGDSLASQPYAGSEN